MESLKKAVNVKRKAIYGIEILFSRLLVVGQQRSIDMANVPPALIDEYGCLRKGDKAVLVKSISVSVMTPSAPDVVLVDGGQLLYHVVWPVLGTTGNVAAGFGIRLTHYPPVSKKIVLFDRYDQEAPSAKDHERTRRGRAKEVRLTPNTPSMPRNYSPQFQEQESAQQRSMQVSPSTQHSTRQQAGLCCYPWWGRHHPLQLHAESGGRRRPD